DFDLAEAVKRPGISEQARPLGLEHLPNRLVALLGVHARAGLGEAARFQPGIELGVVGKVQPRCEQSLARVADLVLDLALLPTRRRRARGRLDQVMRAHRQKAAGGAPPLPPENRPDPRGSFVSNVPS